MPRSAGISVENNFKNGLVTEATGLNFPENACTETYDCVFELDGSIKRRPGFDFEFDYTTKNINRNNSVVVTYLWRNVGGDGNVTLLVVQIGSILYFYKTSGSSVSNGAVVSTVTLTPVSGAPTTEAVEAQFSDGNGLLFVTHRYCEPMRISYNTTTDTATATNITIKIRDFEGTDDGLAIDDRPTATLATLSDTHEYNLRNQGWNTTNLTAWDTAQTTMPSNADQMWRFNDSSDDFSASTASINRITLGNTPAPKGHFVLTLSNQNRDAAAGTTGVPATTTGSERPSTSAFFAGRLFYAGINKSGFNSKIYFSQIIERLEQYGFTYQLNDPSGEDLFDLLPSDGGVLSIPEAGTIYKLFAIPGGLAAFAANGIWFISGSTGVGFTANDYTVQKIASVTTLTASSFVDVGGYPSWWNAEGIYILMTEGGGAPQIKSLSDQKIKSFFEDISIESKRTSKGFFHPINRTIQWLYRSEGTDQLTETYEYDRILNFNVLTGSFYPWRVTDSDVKINSIFVTDSISGAISIDNVITAASDNVIDASGNQVIAFISAGSTAVPTNNYLMSYPSGGTYAITFGSANNEDYTDWFLYDSIGEIYISYFITGYKIRGEGLRKFQTNWIRVFSEIPEEVSYYFQGIWDYAKQGSGTGRWSTKQLVTATDTNYSSIGKRLKVRGHGIALQFRVESVEGEPFYISGWSSLETANAAP